MKGLYHCNSRGSKELPEVNPSSDRQQKLSCSQWQWDLHKFNICRHQRNSGAYRPVWHMKGKSISTARTLYLMGGTSVDINGSTHSFVWGVGHSSPETSSASLPEIKTVVWFVWASPSPSDTCDVTRMILYAIDHRKTAPICIKYHRRQWHHIVNSNKSEKAHVMQWQFVLQPMRVKNMLVRKFGMHQGLQMGFPSLYKELVWWSERYYPRYLHQSKQTHCRLNYLLKGQTRLSLN